MKGGDQVTKDYLAQPSSEFHRKRIEAAPKQEHDLYWDAFNELSTERYIGMSVGPIPVSKVWQLAREYGLTIQEQDTFVYIIRVLDAEYMNLVQERSKNSQSR